MSETLTVYDIAADQRRPATQDDIDKMQEILMAITTHPIRIMPDIDERGRDMNFKLAIFKNPMRNDGVFVAEDKPVTPYKGVRDGVGRPCYPTLPDTPYRIGCQLQHEFAYEIVRRWNRGSAIVMALDAIRDVI